MTRRYEVGYGKPPKQSQFKPGQSGNPAGRKKGSKNVATMVQDAMSETVVINLNGRRRTVSKFEAACMQQANKAAAGDAKAMKLMLDIMAGAQLRDEAREVGVEVTPEARRAADAKLLTVLRDRVSGDDDGL